MTDNVKITIDTLVNKALEISNENKYDCKITDIIDLCYDFNIEYTESLIEKYNLYIP